MSKNLFALFISVIITISSVVTVFSADEDKVNPGDVYVDGIVDIQDVSYLLQYILDKDSVFISDEGLRNANVKNNGIDELTALDAAIIFRKVLDPDFVFPDYEDTNESTSEEMETDEVSSNKQEEETSSTEIFETDSVEETSSDETQTDETEEISEESTKESTEEISEESTDEQTGYTVKWIVDDDAFKSQKGDYVNTSFTVNNLLLTGGTDSNKPLSIMESAAEYDNNEYQYCIKFSGGGDKSKLNVSFETNGECIINVIAIGGSNRYLQLSDKNGNEIKKETAGADIEKIVFNYMGNGERVYLYSAGSSIRIYEIEVIYKKEDAENPSESESLSETSSESTTETSSEEGGDISAENTERFNKLEKMISELMVNNVDSNGNVTYSNISWNVEKMGRNTWHYASGSMIKAFLDIYKRTGDLKYYDYAKKHMDFFINSAGEIIYYSGSSEQSAARSKYSPTGSGYKLDDINPGKPLFYFYEKTGDEKYKKAIDLLQKQLTSQPKTEYNVKGNFCHKGSYPQQIWLDGLYMAQPFYMEYGNTFNDIEVCVDSYNQFLNVYNTMKDEKTGLYYHGYDDAYTESLKQSWSSSETGRSPSFWLRAMGWYAMSLVDTIEKMPESMAEEKAMMINIFKEYTDAIIKYQDKDTGMWYQVVDQGGREGNYLETSGTLAISYSIMKAVRLGYIDESYFEYGEKAFDGVCDNYVNDKNGSMTLSNLCLVAGLSDSRPGTYEYYINETKAENDAKGLGPLLFAYNEIRYKYDK